MRSTRVAVVAVAGAGAALALWLLTVVVGHAGQAVYDLPAFAVALGVAGAVASMAGWALVAWRRDGVVLSLALAGLLFVAGVLSLFSIGLLLLVASIGLAVAAGRAVVRRGTPIPLVALAAAPLIALGLPLAALVAADGPLVTCHGSGVSTSSSVFRPSSSSQGSSRSTPAGVSTGEATIGERGYRYRCDGDRLVEFEAYDAADR